MNSADAHRSIAISLRQIVLYYAKYVAELKRPKSRGAADMSLASPRTLAILSTVVLALSIAPAPAAASDLPPAMGPSEPMVKPIKGDDGLYHQKWFVESFLDLKEDFEAAKAEGKRLAIIFEQLGCGYCTKMHKEVLARKYINDYVRENFHVIQLNLWGDREVTDFDGKVLKEKDLARRWRVQFTPTIVFFKSDIAKEKAKWGQDLEVTRMMLGIGPGTFYDMFVWVRANVYKSEPNFQRFHLDRVKARDAMRKS